MAYAASQHGAASETVIHRLRQAGAVRRDRARPLTDLSANQRRQMNRLVERGVVRRTPAGSFYLDRDALSDFRGWQRSVAFSVFVVLAGLIAGIVLTSA